MPITNGTSSKQIRRLFTATHWHAYVSQAPSVQRTLLTLTATRSTS
jgi:hypothetical protein